MTSENSLKSDLQDAEKVQMGDDVVRVVSQFPFAPVSDSEFLDFPNEPPPDGLARPSHASVSADAFEQCPLCGENVVKGTLQAHISECIADC